MMKSYHIQKLKGIVPPLATPLLDQNTLDKKGIKNLIRHVIDGGVHGLFILGTTGEAPSLSYRLRHQLLEQSIHEVSGQLPVLVGISDTSLGEAINFGRSAEKAGASAVVVAPPYYFPCTQQALFDYVHHLAQEVIIPLFIYNIPSHSPHAFSQDTIIRLLELPQVVGYKDSTCNMISFHQLKHKLGTDFAKSYLLGPEELLAESVMLGGHGGVNGGANVFPKLYVSLYEAAVQGDLQKVNKLHAQVMQISYALYQEGKTVIQGIKFALSQLGICKEEVALPLAALSPKEKEAMQEFLQKFEPVL